MASTKVTDSTFKDDVINSKKPVLVDFWAEWCGPCVQIAPALEELANEYKETLIVAKVNIDENPQTPAKYGVRGIPTLILFKAGEIAATKVGAESKLKLSEWISREL
jgi:thioredoxin 1